MGPPTRKVDCHQVRDGGEQSGGGRHPNTWCSYKPAIHYGGIPMADETTPTPGQAPPASRGGGRKRRTLVRLAVAAGLAIPVTALVPTAAYATPSGCETTTSGGPPYYAEAICQSGTGQYRAVAVCVLSKAGPNGPTYYPRNEYGQIVGIGVVSTAHCQAGAVDVINAMVRFV
jgi:hypothetical protein